MDRAGAGAGAWVGVVGLETTYRPVAGGGEDATFPVFAMTFSFACSTFLFDSSLLDDFTKLGVGAGVGDGALRTFVWIQLNGVWTRWVTFQHHN